LILLDYLNNINLGNDRGVDQNFDEKKIDKNDKMDVFWNEHIMLNNSLISKTFDGLIERVRVCPQNHSVSTFEVFRIFQIPFPSNYSKLYFIFILFYFFILVNYLFFF
jgi:ubiquitin C-terminal hydrolase